MSNLAYPRKKSSILKIVVASDFHIPYHDEIALNLFYQFLKNTQPHRLIIAGDFLDMWELSRFRKFPTMDGNSFNNELETAKKIIKKFTVLCPDTLIDYICGNHSFRIQSYLMEKARELYSLPSLHLEYLLELHKYPQIRFYELKNKSRFSHHFVKYGYLWIGHADMSRKEAAYTARGLRDELGCNLITGHTHKLAFAPKTYKDGTLVAWESGCLCQKETDYSTFSNWQQGWLYLETNPEITQFTIHPILIQNSQFIFNGKVYA